MLVMDENWAEKLEDIYEAETYPGSAQAKLECQLNHHNFSIRQFSHQFWFNPHILLSSNFNSTILSFAQLSPSLFFQYF